MVIWITLPVAIILGFLAGLGVGGGSLLMLWLTFIVGMEYEQARIVNLLFFLPSALIATLFHNKQGSVHIKKILPAILAGCAFAARCEHACDRCRQGDIPMTCVGEDHYAACVLLEK